MAGIGGILRDSEANGNASLAELLAIREAFMVFGASQWANSNTLIIESDSSNAVKWLLNPESAPWQVRSTMLHIEFLKTKIASWSIIHTRREANDVVDKLSKEGMYRSEPYLKVYP
ncbi:hypothetical protein PTKIN_Ptkin14bG0212200 [Pterospermum kingtungense]